MGHSLQKKWQWFTPFLYSIQKMKYKFCLLLQSCTIIKCSKKLQETFNENI